MSDNELPKSDRQIQSDIDAAIETIKTSDITVSTKGALTYRDELLRL